METIAVNDVVKNKCVNNERIHKVAPKMKFKYFYKKKVFTAINEANFRLIDYIVNML